MRYSRVEKKLLSDLGAKSMAVVLFVILFVTFYAFRSKTYIGDGLRHLPVLRTITEHAPIAFTAKPWLEAYRSHYESLVVHNHFLFALVMRTAFAIQQKLGIAGDAIIAMHVVNALSAAIAGGLFFLLALRVGVPRWISLAVTVGVCLSPAYLLAATNVAEAALALPFFVGTLLVLSDCDILERGAFGAGVLAGLAALTYLLAGSLVPGIAVTLVASRLSARSTIRPLLLFLSAFAMVFLGIWVGVLFQSGLRSPIDLVYAIVRFPAQGTYGGFKLGSLVATPVGLAEAFFPVLPDDFRGLRFLYSEQPMLAASAAMVSLIICAFLTRAVYVLFRRGMIRQLLFLSSLLTFLAVEAACVEWDPYYQKLQLFGLILFWMIVVAAFANRQNDRLHKWLLISFVAAVVLSGLGALRRNVQPSQPRENAERLYSIIGSGTLVTSWSSDVAHLWLYSDGSNIISLPDFVLTRNLQVSRVKKDLDAVIEQNIAEGRKVYFYGVFDGDDANLSNIYETRYKLIGFVPYLRSLQRKAQPIEYLRQPGDHLNGLYVYTPQTEMDYGAQ